MLAINILLFGWIGILIWLVQIVWIPFWAAGVINGLGHWWGYRNTDTKDSSTNIFPLAIWIGGEELHNNHHAEPANPRLSRKWWEIDMGWIWINIFKHLRLLKIR
jgi:stearoyl-CoA desaturase (delta-9 desaturase)